MLIDEEQPEGEILNPGLLRKVSSWTHHPCTAAQGGHLTWVNLSPFETIWIHLNPSDSISICLNPSLSISSIQIWIWIYLNSSEPIQIHLNSSESIWTHLNPYKSFWSHQSQTNPVRRQGETTFQLQPAQRSQQVGLGSLSSSPAMLCEQINFLINWSRGFLLSPNIIKKVLSLPEKGLEQQGQTKWRRQNQFQQPRFQIPRAPSSVCVLYFLLTIRHFLPSRPNC